MTPRFRQTEPRPLSPSRITFDVTAAFLLGTAFYYLVLKVFDWLAIPLLRGLAGGPRRTGLIWTYADLSAHSVEPLSAEFRGIVLQYQFLLEIFGALLLSAVFVLALVIWGRGGEPEGAWEDELNSRRCSECLSLIPAAARRCAHCRSQVSQQVEQGDT